MNSSQAQTFIEQWHRIFEEKDPSLMLPLIHDDIEFYSPAVFKPKHGKQAVFSTLNLVFEVFEDYRVTDTWVKENEVLFEFAANVGTFRLQGMDRFRLDDEGKIIQMKVWIRPLTGLKELARTVARRELDNHLAHKNTLQKIVIHMQFRTKGLIQSLKEKLK